MVEHMDESQNYVSGPLGVMGAYLRHDPRNFRGWTWEYFARRTFSRAALAAAIITREVELADISFWQGQPNFSTMRLRTDVVIVRIGQNTWPDPQFKRNWAEAKAKGFSRGAYFFYDDRATPADQARLIVDSLRDDPPELPVFIDWETKFGGPYVGLARVVELMKLVEAGLPGVTVGIYTGYYFFKDNSSATLNPSEYAYLRTKPLWLAWYTSNPAYVLIPAPWTSLTFWQYGTPAIGSSYGVESVEIDMNWFNGTRAQFNERYGTEPPPEPPPPQDPPVSLMKIRAYNSDVYILRIRASASNIEVHAHGARETSLKVASETGAVVVVNGGDYDPYTGDPTGLVAVNGRVISVREGYMPWLNVTQRGEVQINEWNSPEAPYNAIALRRMLVTNGAVDPDQSAAWREVHPRTFYGVTADGDLVAILVDGRTAQSAGADLYAGAQLLINAGCVRGGDAGGGGDTQGVYNGVVINVPIADKVPGELRPVADHIVVFTKGDSSGMKAQEKLGKVVTIRSAPAVRSGNDVGAVSPRAIVDYVAIVTDLDNPMYKWLKLAEGKYVNYDYPPNGLRFDLLSAPPPPTTGAPKVTSAVLSLTFDDGATTTTNLKPEA